MSENNISKLEWEILEKITDGHSSDDGNYYRWNSSIVERTKVFGGWLVRSTNDGGSGDRGYGQTNTGAGLSMGKARGTGSGLAFVPDLNHEWRV